MITDTIFSFAAAPQGRYSSVLKFIMMHNLRQALFSGSYGDALKAENKSHQGVPLPSDYVLDSSVAQRKAADGAALAVGDEQATPRLFGSRGQT